MYQNEQNTKMNCKSTTMNKNQAQKGTIKAQNCIKKKRKN